MGIHRTKILGFAVLLAGLTLCAIGLRLLVGPAQYQATVIIPPKIPIGSDRLLGALLFAIGLFPAASGVLLLRSSSRQPS
jgi:hypothetical protein